MPEDKLDINDPLLQQEMVEADPNADWFEQPPLPPDDRTYQIKILLGERGVAPKRQQRKGDQPGQPKGPAYLSFQLELRIVDPGEPWDNAPTTYYADSLIYDNKATSRLHTILRAVGAFPQGRLPLTGPGSLLEHALGVFASEPLALAKGKWEARVKDADGTYRTVKKGMKNFPLVDPAQPELGHSPYIEDEVRTVRDPKTQQLIQVGTGEMVRAYFQVNEIFAQ